MQHLVEDRPIDELEFTLSSEDIGKKWKKWQEGSKDADRSVESITTSLGMARIKGVDSKSLRTPEGGISRVWCFQSEEFLRKRYGLDTIINERREESPPHAIWGGPRLCSSSGRREAHWRSACVGWSGRSRLRSWERCEGDAQVTRRFET